MNNTSIRFKLRGKLRSFVFLTCVATALFLIYKALIDEVVVTPVFHSSNGNAGVESRNTLGRGPGMFEDVNDLMPITQPREHLERMRQQEAQMMRNVQKIIHHRIKETSNRTRNGSAHAKHPHTPLSLWDGIRENEMSPPIPKHVLKKRFVHLDLKGAAPTVDYIRRLFPLLNSLGATGVLIEYEDMFPYWGKLDDIKAYNSYTTAEIAQILRLADNNGLEVIPLIQTFGHMEMILKRENFKALREVPTFPQAVCPSNNRTLSVLREMIDQILILHRNAKYIHIGCDEVYNIGECPICQERLEKMQWNTENLFLSHALAITRYIKKHHNVQPIMWDDMFRQISEELLRSSEIGKYTDILVWKYGSTVAQDLTASIWQKYTGNFAGIWIASAFKGATHPASVATPIQARLDNHISWMQVVEEFSTLVPFRGIFLTGWQRFDHFSVLCELLPAGIPSLAINLQYLQHLTYDHVLEQRVQTLLGCNRPVSLDLNVTNPEIQCTFPAANVYQASLQFSNLEYYLNQEFFESNYVKGWVSDYNVKYKFSSPALIEQAIMRYSEGVRNVSVFQNAASDALGGLYDRYTVAEWLDTNVKPLLKRLDEYMAKMKILLLPNTWPRRPISLNQPEQRLKSGEVVKRFQHAPEP